MKKTNNNNVEEFVTHDFLSEVAQEFGKLIDEAEGKAVSFNSRNAGAANASKTVDYRERIKQQWIEAGMPGVPPNDKRGNVSKFCLRMFSIFGSGVVNGYSSKESIRNNVVQPLIEEWERK